MSIKNKKKALQTKILGMRDRLSPREISGKSLLIKKLLFELPEFYRASLIMFYVSFRSEVETFGMIREALALGKRVMAPAANPATKELEVFSIRDLSDLSPGTYGILEPKMQLEPIDPATIDLVIVPGCAFDLKGFRLGYGAGYYDRFLQRVPESTSIALAFDFQTLSEIPHIESHDVPVDKIITEKRVIDCQQYRQA